MRAEELRTKVVSEAAATLNDEGMTEATANAAMVAKVEQKYQPELITRGRVGGPATDYDRVEARSYVQYYITFRGGEFAEVAVVGDGDTDLDLYIYDENGNLIDSDIDYTDACYCSFVPSWTGSFRVKIVNRGSVYNRYTLITN